MITMAAMAGLVWPAVAGAEPEITLRPAAEAPVELLRPASGQTLRGGEPATVAWRARGDLAAAGIEEWEAFLSFDGGRTWPVRLTPHLDISVSSFGFVVPRVASDEVRLMLRFGDERREVGYVLPLELRSTEGRETWTPSPALAFGRGEVARPGDDGVVLWVEGDRDGRRTVTRTVGWDGGDLRTVTVPATSRPLPALSDQRWSEEARAVAARGVVDELSHLPGPGHRCWALACPLILLLCRRNE